MTRRFAAPDEEHAGACSDELFSTKANGRPNPTVIWTNRSSSKAASEPDNAARATCPRLPDTQEDKNELDQKNTPHNNDVEQRPSFGHDRINHRSFV
jgi:1,2-phenylacetyl-CoA epoxidase PaaB subunit